MPFLIFKFPFHPSRSVVFHLLSFFIYCFLEFLPLFPVPFLLFQFRFPCSFLSFLLSASYSIYLFICCFFLPSIVSLFVSYFYYISFFCSFKASHICLCAFISYGELVIFNDVSARGESEQNFTDMPFHHSINHAPGPEILRCHYDNVHIFIIYLLAHYHHIIFSIFRSQAFVLYSVSIMTI